MLEVRKRCHRYQQARDGRAAGRCACGYGHEADEHGHDEEGHLDEEGHDEEEAVIRRSVHVSPGRDPRRALCDSRTLECCARHQRNASTSATSGPTRGVHPSSSRARADVNGLSRVAMSSELRETTRAAAPPTMRATTSPARNTDVATTSGIGM